MSQITNKQFTVGDEFPDWFKEELSKGRAKVIRDDDNEIDKIIITSPTKTYAAYPGDVIMLFKPGMTVVSKKAAVKYGVRKESKEDKEE